MRYMTLSYFGQFLGILVTTLSIVSVSYAVEPAKTSSSYAPVDIKESFSDVLARMKAEKPEVMNRQMDLLNRRYEIGRAHV